MTEFEHGEEPKAPEMTEEELEEAYEEHLAAKEAEEGINLKDF